MKKLVIGILAHVDAGKTTLSEGLLYLCGGIRRLGRVDHGDAFLDSSAIERQRGITIFSRQARLQLKNVEVQLLDTPGHVDFSAEMERTLQVLDYAILVISGTDGVQSHTKTLWQLLARYDIPTFLLINKMDLPGTERKALMRALRAALGDGCVDFTDDPDPEQAAMCDERLLERYLETDSMDAALLREAVAARRLFPCWFGSALKLEGLEGFLDGLEQLTRLPAYPPEFGARVYKISRDKEQTRLTWLKVTGGTLRVKQLLRGSGWEEKADQLRLYSGDKFELTDAAPAGTVVAVTGLGSTLPGDGLGAALGAWQPALQPVLTYGVTPSCAAQQALVSLRQLAEEDPMLHVLWDGSQIQMQLMGEVQLEVLEKLIAERFGFSVTFDAGQIVYRETILTAVEGVGHFEALRHYAEVHLLMEPGEPGSGVTLDTVCSEDVLDRNWQRLIFTHLEEKVHRGVLIGAPITDVKITLLTGRAHLKHTEGGDFRQATYRAVRQGLMQSQSQLLEPWYAFQMTLPQENVGRAMTDVQQMAGTFEPPQTERGMTLLQGRAPVSAMRGYSLTLTAYTRGSGRLSCTLAGFAPCHNAAAVIAARDYHPAHDLENTPDSVFCAHGSGVIVPWNEVRAHMHLDSGLRLGMSMPEPDAPAPRKIAAAPGPAEQDKELLAIFERTYGAISPRKLMPTGPALPAPVAGETLVRLLDAAEEYLLVDGYNIIFAWDDLKELARDSLDLARSILINRMCNFQAYRKCGLIVVFDAYKVPGGTGSVEQHNGIFVVYTKEAELADTYIERTTYALGKRYHIRVATSDGLEQSITLGHGALRVPASAFKTEVDQVLAQMSQTIRQNNKTGGLSTPRRTVQKKKES
ncbi:MAG: TetM/TetW/TetO/TetS family tetracycline resistance ribosomal protection protein [Oscillospiraceae bacterium]|nr:TetM/TetW/TetO/TetS family tetracycline resistance ribosomal protection protein [Oscillospiraceae bacterium]